MIGQQGDITGEGRREKEECRKGQDKAESRNRKGGKAET
jgi:hypothetical protein